MLFAVLIGGRQIEQLLGRWGHALVFVVVAGQSAGGGPVLRRYARRLRLTPSRITGLRTWAAVLAGADGMPARRFLIFNLIGGVLRAVLKC
jgi:membrane protein DedA with SNARE-associated domain